MINFADVLTEVIIKARINFEYELLLFNILLKITFLLSVSSLNIFIYHINITINYNEVNI